MLDEMVLTREPIAALARTVLNGTIAEDWVVHAGLVAFQICQAREGLAAVVAGEGLGSSSVNVRQCVPQDS